MTIQYKCNCGTIVSTPHKDIIPICNNCEKHVVKLNEYVPKKKELTCRNCVYKISYTDLKHKHDIDDFCVGFGLYCSEGVINYKLAKWGERRLFYGLKNKACEKIILNK